MQIITLYACKCVSAKLLYYFGAQMSKLVRFGVSLDNKLLEKFDEKIKTDGYETRSKAIGDLLKKYTDEKMMESGDDVVGVITVIYDFYNVNMLSKVVNVQQEQSDIVVAIQHVHLDGENCLEILAVKGSGEEVNNLYDSLRTIKGVRYVGKDVSCL